MCDCTAHCHISYSFFIHFLYSPLPFYIQSFISSSASQNSYQTHLQSKAIPQTIGYQATLPIPTYSKIPAKVSPPRSSTTYYYYPRTSPYRPISVETDFEYITVARTPQYTPPPTPPTPSLTTSSISTPSPSMGAHTAPRVSFAPSASAARQPDDEEHDVMTRFARHAARCITCHDPVSAYHSSTGSLCDSGNMYARDVAQYIYSKNGKAYSVVDRQQRHEKIQIEVPQNLAVIKKLCRAVDEGLTLKREERVKIVDHRTAPAPRPAERREEYASYGYDTVTIRPGSSREEKRRHDGRGEKSSGSERKEKRDTVYVKGRGSLYERDEAERRARLAREGPIIVDVSPRGGRYNR